MKNLIQKTLKWQATAILNKYQPKVIGITGSVGKSSTKEAVFAVTSKTFTSRKTLGNYNTEIGVPLTIIDSYSGRRNIFKWLYIFLKAFKLILFKVDFPEVLVLEMAADKPGDIKYLSSFIKTDVAIITSIGISHLENFKTKENIYKEKISILESLKPDGIGLVNVDDPKLATLKKNSQLNIFSYAIKNEADIKASEIVVDSSNLKSSFELLFKGDLCNQKQARAHLERAVGEPMIYSSLAAVAVGCFLEIPLIEVVNNLSQFEPLPGRLKLISGMNNSLIIDDSYNAAPDSMIKALEVLSQVKAGRKIAILGKMAELGETAEIEHEKIGRFINSNNIDQLIVKRNLAYEIAEGAIKAGFPREKVFSFKTEDELLAKLVHQIEPKDVILVKASRSEHFENIIKNIMAEPDKAKELLVS